ncbi:FUSC family protein [Nocardiopsis sp. FIRDI 009]|uniref:FUSC family protein n=1 Tax=Nocardiopsis sp. FIRDI 009 TaxID=714197 RepID=UPI000E27A07B|nr:FUSC family protein [Nocardiopsis sp. FIRDI 009]
MIGNVAVTAVRAGLCVAVPLVALVGVGRLDLAPYAALGCFTALYARDDAYARRRRVLALVGATLTVSVLVGSLTRALVGGAWVPVLVVAVVAAAVKFVSDAWGFGPPGGMMFVFAAGVSSYTPQSMDAIPVQVAATATAAALCWVVASAGVLVHPSAPERLVVARALVAVAHQLRDPSLERRRDAEAAVCGAWESVVSAPRRRVAVGELEVLTARADLALAGSGDRAVDARTAAELTGLARRCRRRRVPEVGVGQGERAVLAAHAERVRGAWPGAPGWGARLGRAWRWPSAVPVSVARVLVAAAVAGALAPVLGVEHWYWAVVSAASVLQATNASSTWRRTVQRATGTVAGIVVAAVVFAVDHTVWSTVVLIVVCQVGVELVVMTHYAYAVVLVTPLTLALSSLTQPGAATDGMVVERFWATVLGAVVGAVVCVVVLNRRGPARVEAALAVCERACARVESGGGVGDRYRLAGALVDLWRVQAEAEGEVWSRGGDVGRVRGVESRARALVDEARVRVAGGRSARGVGVGG